MKIIQQSVLIVLLCAAGFASVFAESIVFQSGPKQAVLVELFSSEGCSSCPAAENWFTALKADRRLWKDFVPVSFHVDYWNQTGWKDRFASKEFTKRQWKYVKAWDVPAVYTPGVVLNGKEWRDWYRADSVPSQTGQSGVLKVTQIKEGQFEILFVPSEETSKKWEVSASLMGFGISSPVKRGENRGKTFNHDFITLDFETKKLKRTQNGWQAVLNLKSKPEFDRVRHGLAVWVTDGNQTNPVQAAGGYLS